MQIIQAPATMQTTINVETLSNFEYSLNDFSQMDTPTSDSEALSRTSKKHP